jgi:hypothetical protein
MVPEYRRAFNETYTQPQYAKLLDTLSERTGTPMRFRISETPCFFPRALIEKMARYGQELTHQLLSNPQYIEASAHEIPDEFRVPNEDSHPLFIQADFGLDEAGEPKLVEIQGFPSLYAFQRTLAQSYIEAYGLNQSFSTELVPNYLDLFRQAVLGDHDPKNVILMEVDPLHQKTLQDFLLTEKICGIKTVCIKDVVKRGNRLYYGDTPVERIYNRAIVDEIQRKGVRPGFDFRDELNVEWAGHPNWYFRISKFSLPFLHHVCMPRTSFLSEVSRIPDDLCNYVLKPLYSFAGIGVIVGPTREQLEAVNREHYILQQRVNFAPVIETPFGPTKAEVRIMYIWLDQLTPVTTIIRMGRGKMMGVDHNRDMEWVGASAGFVV